MGFVAAVKTCMSKFATFEGRARRAEYWMFYLFLNLVSLAGCFVVVATAIATAGVLVADNQGPSMGAFAIYFIILALWILVNLVLMVPFLAVSARRLHDMGQSGHWLWLNLAGLGIVAVVMAFLDSEWGPNRWGPDPKAAERGHFPGGQQYGYPVPPQYPGQPY